MLDYEMKIELVKSIPIQATLGEGVTWDHRTGEAMWTDIEGRRLYRYRYADERLSSISMPERLGAFGLARDSNWIIAGFESGFAWFNIRNNGILWIAQPERGDTGRRLNDGRVDPYGRFWCGSMIEAPKNSLSKKGSLYRLNMDASVHRMLGDIEISNGLAWSPNGSVMYFADSPKRTIWAFDFSAAGALSNRRVFAMTPENVFPDGAVVDADGCLWSAQWGGSRIVRYAPDGDALYELAVPVPQPSCVAFGGSNLDLLFVTTARDGLSKKALDQNPLSGDVFVYRLPVSGVPSNIFSGALPN